MTPRRPPSRRVGALLLLGLLAPSPTRAGAPADALPTPRPERCIPFDADPAEGEMIAPSGLGYDEVRAALNGVIQHALGCRKPATMTEVHLTFELVVACTGVVSRVTVSDDGGAPADYVACVSAVVAKADFPAHDMADGFPITYPVDVRW